MMVGTMLCYIRRLFKVGATYLISIDIYIYIPQDEMDIAHWSRNGRWVFWGGVDWFDLVIQVYGSHRRMLGIN